MLQNIVDRAKKMAIKEQLETGAGGLRVSHLMAACVDEFKENEDLPNTTNPDDWARISGKKGERIVYIRTLISGKGPERDRAVVAFHLGSLLRRCWARVAGIAASRRGADGMVQPTRVTDSLRTLRFT